MAVAALLVASAAASGSATKSTTSPATALILQRFLSIDDPAPTNFRVLRHIDARCEALNKSAWMDVWTEADGGGFRYRIVAEGGSDYIRSKVFRASLETERKIWAEGTPARAALTPANYVFGDASAQADGLASFTLTPRRKDQLLVDGSIYLTPDNGDLVRLEGRLVKAPSFWTRKVEIVRHYRRIGGIRLPVALESVAHILMAGKSSMRVTYDYETVNGRRFGSPKPRVASSAP